MGQVRSAHLADGHIGGAGSELIYTAPALTVPVIKCCLLSTTGVVAGFPASAFVSCQRSGGGAAILVTAIAPGYAVNYGGTMWVVLDPGDQLYLNGDGLNEWDCTVDGALLVDTP